MFNSANVAERLSGLGVMQGDILYMHVAFGKMPGLRGTTGEMIGALRELVGPGGTLLVPAAPARTRFLISYMRSDPVFDVNRTPTKLGLFQEIFRRTTGAFRSLHPWGSACALGPHSEQLLREHHLDPDAYSPLSPYLKMRDLGGKIVGIGADIDWSTFIHAMDSLLRDYYPFPVYEPAPLTARVIDWEGRELRVAALMIRQEIATCIHPIELKPYLIEAGALNQGEIEGSTFYSMKVTDYIRVATETALRQMAAGEPPCWLREHCRKYNIDFKPRNI